jgi:hypothetical protein
MMCAVDVPAFKIHTPFSRRCSGSPSEACVAPGTAIAAPCRRRLPIVNEVPQRESLVVTDLFTTAIGLKLLYAGPVDVTIRSAGRLETPARTRWW